MSQIKSVREADVAGKRVLLRVDFNVPLDFARGKPHITDDARLKRALPTINFLLESQAKEITILSHLGRPEGRVVEELRMAPVEARLRELVSFPNLRVRENLRFDPREENNNETFARELASEGDIYVNDAFGNMHRAHASVVGIPKLLPSFMGLLVEEELSYLEAALTPPAHALAVIGGAKFETKRPLLEKLLQTYEKVFLGGALGNDLLKARGMPIGASLVSQAIAPTVLAADERLIAPVDIAVLEENTNVGRSTWTADVRAKESIVDIGPHTAALWAAEISKAPFVLWNGPLGKYEDGFVEGTDAVAAALSKGSAKALIGGGDTMAALTKNSFDPKRIFVSTGGGAMLEYLVNRTLVGLEALKQ